MHLISPSSIFANLHLALLYNSLSFFLSIIFPFRLSLAYSYISYICYIALHFIACTLSSPIWAISFLFLSHWNPLLAPLIIIESSYI